MVVGASAFGWGFLPAAGLCGQVGGPLSIDVAHLHLPVARFAFRLAFWVVQPLSVTLLPDLAPDFWVGEGRPASFGRQLFSFDTLELVWSAFLSCQVGLAVCSL